MTHIPGGSPFLGAPSVARISDFASFSQWAKIWLQTALPHGTLICGQIVTASNGCTEMHTQCLDVPTTHTQDIALNSLRGPLGQSLLQWPERTVFFDAERDPFKFDNQWLARFKAAQWGNVMAMGWQDTDDHGHLRKTLAGFCNVPSNVEPRGDVLRIHIMPRLCKALSQLAPQKLRLPTLDSDGASRFTATEAALCQLLVRGFTNKQIAKVLGKSDQTVKHQIATLLQKTGAINRVELAVRLPQNLHRSGHDF